MKTVTVLISNTSFVIPQSHLANFISLMTDVKIKEGYGASAEMVDIKFSLDYEQVSQEPKTDREKALEEERDARSRWWQEETVKVSKLEKELKELKARRDD